MDKITTKNKYSDDYEVRVYIQAIDEKYTQLVVPVILSSINEVVTPCSVILPEEKWITGTASANRDDGSMATSTIQFQPSEGLLVTFKFILHNCSCCNWLKSWNFLKFFKCIFGSKKRCK